MDSFPAAQKPSGSRDPPLKRRKSNTFDDLAIPHIHATALRRRVYDSDVQELSKKDKGKTADRSQATTFSLYSRLRRCFPAEEEDNEAPKDKHSDRVEKQSYGGPLAHAEFERMRKEIDQLKKSAQDSRKAVKKQAKEIKDLKARLQEECTLKANHELEITTLKEKLAKNEELITTVEQSLQCQICMDLLHRPYSLSSCGHILCLECLQSWFRQAPPPDTDGDDESDDMYSLLSRPKSCPCCRAPVNRRPVPAFLVKSVTGVLANAKDGSSRIPTTSLPPEGDPWEGLFRNSDDDRETSEDDDDDENDDDDDEDDEVLDVESDSDDEHSGIGWPRTTTVTWTFNSSGGQFALGYSMSSPSGSEYGGEDDDFDEEDGDDEAERVLENADLDEPTLEVDLGFDWDERASVGEHARPVYVPRRWQPPTVWINPADYEGCFPDRTVEEEEMILTMLRRGCTYPMIRTYYMEYNHSRGLVAKLRSLDHPYIDSEEEENRAVDGWGFHHLWVGWNVTLEEADVTGETFIEGLLREMKENPEEWECRAKPGEGGVYDVMRLVRAGAEEAEEYETTDTEVWLDANESYGL